MSLGFYRIQLSGFFRIAEDSLRFFWILYDSTRNLTGNQSYNRQPVLQATGPTGNRATGNQSQLSGFSKVLWESHGFLLFFGSFKFL